VTNFSKSKSKVLSFEPTFLPPVTTQAKRLAERNANHIFEEKTPEIMRDRDGKQAQIKRVRAFEDSHSLPKYTDKNPREKNTQNTKHLMKGDAKMSTILWESGLRE
jgi:hypothetical protein